MAFACPTRPACSVLRTTHRLQSNRSLLVAGGQPPCHTAVLPHRVGRSLVLSVRAERSSGGFATGFILGGVVFGALGFLFAPQISAALLGDDQRLKLPRFLEDEEKDPEATKQDLADKIAQLNSAIDDVSAQLRAQDELAKEETVPV